MIRRDRTPEFAPPDLDPLSVEFFAICAVGKGLASLKDPEARMRVLRWANERFQPASTVPSQAAPAQVPAPDLAFGLTPESDLTVDGLDHLFDERVDLQVAAPPPAPFLAPEPEPIVDGLDDLFEGTVDSPPEEIADDSGVVLSEAEDLRHLYELPSEPARPLLHLVPREELPFDQLVDDFVDSFRRLSREWQGV